MDAAYFNDLYASDPDPWRFETSAYERDKYAATLAALPRPRYRAGLDVGCSIGVLTQGIAARCDSLLAIDPAEQALEQARRRCAAKPNVAFRRIAVPDEWPDGGFDLIMLSEVVYYFTPAQVALLAQRVGAALRPQGDIALVHWLGETDYPLSGDDAASAFIAAAAPFSRVIGSQRTPDYRIDLLRAAPAA